MFSFGDNRLLFAGTEAPKNRRSLNIKLKSNEGTRRDDVIIPLINLVGIKIINCAFSYKLIEVWRYVDKTKLQIIMFTKFANIKFQHFRCDI